MKALLFFLMIIILGPAIAMANAADEQPVAIPLEKIWAYQMPGTGDITKLEKNKSTKMIDEIRRALGPPMLNKPGPTKMPDPRSGFAVKGAGGDALRQAYFVLVKGRKARTNFAADETISIVFFSHQFGPFVHLSKVQRAGNQIDVRYKFVPHESEQVTEHIAIIPLGELPTGTYEVTFNQQPLEKQFTNQGFQPIPKSEAQDVVCGPFKFTVGEGTKKNDD